MMTKYKLAAFGQY